MIDRVYASYRLSSENLFGLTHMAAVNIDLRKSSQIELKLVMRTSRINPEHWDHSLG